MPNEPVKKPAVPKVWEPEVVGDPERSLPPWERANPTYGIGAGKDEKANNPVSVKLTTKENRDIQKIVQHRKIPAIETKSDVIRCGLMMFRYWYAKNHNALALEEIDVEMWENERAARDRQRKRVSAIIDGLTMEMAEAYRLGYTNRLAELLDELRRYRGKLKDEELKGKADRLYVEYVGRSKSSK